MILVFAFVTALGAQAQDVGFVAGIANTDASVGPDILGASVDSEIGWRLGVNVKLDLVDQLQFRTGGLYVFRPVTMSGAGSELKFKMSYLDIPALFQYSFNDMISVYAGPVVGINVGEKVSGAFDGDASDLVPGNDTKSIYLMAQVGLNFNFDGIGFDVYYERGFGDMVEREIEDYNSIGANFIYWF
jgi:hypothetical protein